MKQCKPKKCRECKAKFTPRNSLTIVCSPKCAITRAQRVNGDKRIAKLKKERREQRRDAKKRLGEMKTRTDWMKEVQTVFNRFIRMRDEGNVCISCQKPPKKKNAGHYKSVGACPELRFDEKNCHLQCEFCNTYKSGNQIEYRINLINKIGIESVELLEGAHEAKKYTIDELKDLKQYYVNKTKNGG